MKTTDMESIDIQPLVMVYHRKLAETALTFKRYLYNKINWNVRMIGIKGERGVGKTTLVLQHIKESFQNPDEAFYVSLDNLWFSTHSLSDLVDYLYGRGIVHLYLDEVHKYGDWSRMLKNLYDNYPGLNVVYSGSSMLEIDNSRDDLSRRQTLYTLYGMSFREYLEYENIFSVPDIPLEKILTEHVGIALDISSKVKILKYYDDFIRCGSYPFYKEAGMDYHLRLQEVVAQVLESDVPAVENITFETIRKTQKLLMIIAGSLPFIPNVSRLCQALDCTRDSCLKLLYALDKSGILHILTVEMKNYKKLVSPDKIFLGNTNLMYALGVKIDEGTLRETFFASQVGAVYPLQYPKKGDFFVCGKYLFEIGGKGKTFGQIKDEPDSFLAVADTEVGTGARIPLWMFGMLY